MKAIEAHELATADPGVEIVLSTAGFTYIGWFAGERHSKKLVEVKLDDSDGRVVTAIVSPTHTVQITPFSPLAPGDVVRRRGWDSPEHRSYGRTETGTVVAVKRDTANNRVYEVQWEREPGTRWHTRRNVEALVWAEGTRA